MTVNHGVAGSSPARGADEEAKTPLCFFKKCGCGVMAAAPDLGSGAVRRGGSSPFIRTPKKEKP